MVSQRLGKGGEAWSVSTHGSCGHQLLCLRSVHDLDLLLVLHLDLERLWVLLELSRSCHADAVLLLEASPSPFDFFPRRDSMFECLFAFPAFASLRRPGLAGTLFGRDCLCADVVVPGGGRFV